MASVKYEVGSTSTVMTTALDGLAANSNAISDEIDNSTTKYLFDDVELSCLDDGYSSFADGSGFDLYMVRKTLDDGSFEDGDGSIDPPASNLIGVFGNNTTSNQIHILRQIPIPPAPYKYVIINRSGDFGSSGSTLKVRPYRYQTT